ncbi:MAG TPA: hypothetical protein VH419_04540 [Nocardioidaceae bacterium]
MYRHNTTHRSSAYRLGRGAIIAGGLVAVAFVGISGPATGSHTTHDAPAHSVTNESTVTTPCFMVPTGDRWPAHEVGPVPRCEHTYGATEQGRAFQILSDQRNTLSNHRNMPIGRVPLP